MLSAARIWPAAAVALALAFVLTAVVYPMAALAARSLLSASGGPTSEHWKDMLASPFLGTALRNTLLISSCAALLAVTIGGGLAVASARISFPGRSLLRATMLSPFLISQSVMAIAWVILAEEKAGLLNVLLRSAGAPFSVEILSAAGIVFVTFLLTLPLAFFGIESLASSINPDLEEAALICGASRAATLARIVVPLLWPGIAAAALLCFMLSNVMFSVQGVLGIPANVWTMSTLIYFMLGSYPSRLGAATALALTLLAAGLLLLLAQQSLLARGDYHVAAGRRQNDSRWPLPPRGRWLAGGAVACLFALLLVLPYGALAFRSLAPFHVQVQGGLDAILRGWDLSAYGALLDDGASLRAFGNSLKLALGASASCTVLSFILAYVSLRSRLPGRRWLTAACVAPFAFSGMILAIAFIVAFSSPRLGLYGTLWMLLLIYIVRELAIGFKLVRASLAQVEPELEESALVCGASLTQTVRLILWPLISPTLLAVAVLSFLAAYREIESSVLLAGPGREVFGYQVFTGFQNGTWREISAMAIVGVAVCGAAAAAGAALKRLIWTESNDTGGLT